MSLAGEVATRALQPLFERRRVLGIMEEELLSLHEQRRSDERRARGVPRGERNAAKCARKRSTVWVNDFSFAESRRITENAPGFAGSWVWCVSFFFFFFVRYALCAMRYAWVGGWW